MSVSINRGAKTNPKIFYDLDSKRAPTFWKPHNRGPTHGPLEIFASTPANGAAAHAQDADIPNQVELHDDFQGIFLGLYAGRNNYRNQFVVHMRYLAP